LQAIVHPQGLHLCFNLAVVKQINRFEANFQSAHYVKCFSQSAAKQFDTICATLGIQRILASPYAPEGKGKVERFFGFVRSDFLPELAHASITSLTQLNESLLAWLEVVYHRKLHTETGQAPLERYRQDPAPATRPVDPATLRQAFLHRDQRTITKTATFSFQGNRYRVPAYLCGQSVELRYDPFDLSRLELWFQDTFLQMAQPDQLVHPIHPDVEPDPRPASPPLDTGLDYLALLRTEHHRLLQAQLEGIHFSQLADRPQPQPSSPADDPAQEANDDRPQ
jgi:putative transposase